MAPPFPVDVREFDSDDRISFSRLDNKFIAVHDDGTEFEFDAEAKRWVLADEEPIDNVVEDDAAHAAPSNSDDASSRRRRRDGAEDGSEV